MESELRAYIPQIEALAQDQGLDYYPVEFEIVPPAFMLEISIYGLPVRIPHWSFGVRYIYQLVQHRMGHSRVFEVVFPGNPGRAYLANSNSLEENTLVVAHVLGHADFAKNNHLFAQSQEQVGYNIVEQAAAHAGQITRAMELHGVERVEKVLDAALALEQHIDTHLGLHRESYPEYQPQKAEPREHPKDAFRERYEELTNGASPPELASNPEKAPIPPKPEHDLLWFIARYAPDMEDWERDIFLTVREESFYFQPVFACQIMNEGWASYWHARLLREGKFLPSDLYVQAIKTHSDVVRPYAGEHQVALAINPYHLGFSMWEKIIEEKGLAEARRIMSEDDDFGFVRNHLTQEMADELRLFEYKEEHNGRINIETRDINRLREQILAPKFNFGAPRVYVDELRRDGALVLRHDHKTDGRGLDMERAEKVLAYVQSLWRRPVTLFTADRNGDQQILQTS
ncbi:MAG: SpoVR family protein [Candidatus Thiodiazotropha sp. (ex Monitilora ramsayi)]|nr:SpoVR family protein [Candidatus Thiodiazotropha sp. (ex Monitilora ramsayi)]